MPDLIWIDINPRFTAVFISLLPYFKDSSWKHRPSLIIKDDTCPSKVRRKRRLEREVTESMYDKMDKSYRFQETRRQVIGSFASNDQHLFHIISRLVLIWLVLSPSLCLLVLYFYFRFLFFSVTKCNYHNFFPTTKEIIYDKTIDGQILGKCKPLPVCARDSRKWLLYTLILSQMNMVLIGGSVAVRRVSLVLRPKSMPCHVRINIICLCVRVYVRV